MSARSVHRLATLHCLAVAGQCLVVAGLISSSGSAVAADWARFRGPNGSGVSGDKQPVPVVWSPTENLQWKVELPGPGSSSPIVVGQRVYVTCWSGYGTDRTDPGDQKQLRRHLVCLDRDTGTIVWSKSVKPKLPEDKYQGMFAEHGYASHTPASDGKRIYVYFGKTGALAFDLDGNQLWQTEVGSESDPRGWGSASSPILFQNILIVTATAEAEALVGLDTETGNELWRQEAAGFNATWGTPVMARLSQRRTDLVIGVPNEIWGFNPRTGKLRWYCQAMQNDSFCSSLVAHEDMVYAIEGRGNRVGRDDGAIAVRAGGKGDVTDSHTAWSTKHANRIGTPIYYQGRIYFITRGIVNCIDAKTGEELVDEKYKHLFKARLVGSQVANQKQASGGRRFGNGGGFGGDYASPVIANGRIYFVARNGNMFVLNAGDKFEQLAVNRVTDEREDFSATPAISNGQLFVRSSRYVYCIAFDQPPAAADLQPPAAADPQPLAAADPASTSRSQSPRVVPPPSPESRESRPCE